MLVLTILNYVYSENKYVKLDNDKKITWVNYLPSKITQLTDIDYITSVIPSGDINYNMTINTKLVNNNSVLFINLSINDDDFLNANTFIKNVFDKYDNLNFSPFYKYMTYINKWFFKNINNQSSEFISSMNSMGIIYEIDIYHNGCVVKVVGKNELVSHYLPGSGRTPGKTIQFWQLTMKEPIVFVTQSLKEWEIYGTSGVEGFYDKQFITLPKAYNAATEEYNSSYYLYEFFGNLDLIVKK